MKLFVTGGNGAVGSYVPAAFEGWELRSTDIDSVDITDARKIRDAIVGEKPDAVLHLAAEVDVDRCEKEPEYAYRVNAMGTENVALACRDAEAKLIYISTGGVFSGELGADAKTEYDAPLPANVYAAAKLEGERAVSALVPEHFIVRAGWMIGGGRRDKKFVYKILKMMNERETVKAVDDKQGTLTYALDLLRQARVHLESGRPGVYHGASAGVVTRYDVAVELAGLTGQKTRIERCGSDAFPLPAPRAASEAIRNYKAELLGINGMSDWRSALARYVDELKSVGVLVDGKVRDL